MERVFRSGSDPPIMRRVALLVGLLVVASVAPSLVGAAPPEVDSPTTEFHVRLQPNGDAQWEVSMQFDLDSETEAAAFRNYTDEFENGDASVGPSLTFFESAAREASQHAGREMRITNVTYDSALDEEAGTGTLSLRFVWTSFLAGGGDRYVLRDALLTGDDETWLRTLEDGQSLRIYTPRGYEIAESSIRSRQVNASLIVDGPVSYDGDDEFRIVYDQTNPGSGTDSPGSPGTQPPNDPDIGAGVVGGLLLVALAILAVWLWQRRDDSGASAGRPDGPDDGTGAAATEAPADGESTTDSPAGGTDGAAASAAVDLELLSDEERVERLLERNGGRMRQADIVTETDWSDAKVSQLLSRMADDGRVEKLRLGRENLISLPDDETESGPE
jgi:hypothetical protein